MGKVATPRLHIVPFEERHLTERYIGWLNDPKVVRYSEQRHNRHDFASCWAYFENARRASCYFSAIEEVQYGHIGNMTISIDVPNKLADIAILVGERRVWGRGYGFEAWDAVLSALFEREGFRKVTGGTVELNVAMIRIMKKARMEPDGRRRAHYLIEGNAVDVVNYASFSGNGRKA